MMYCCTGLYVLLFRHLVFAFRPHPLTLTPVQAAHFIIYSILNQTHILHGAPRWNWTPPSSVGRRHANILLYFQLSSHHLASAIRRQPSGSLPFLPRLAMRYHGCDLHITKHLGAELTRRRPKFVLLFSEIRYVVRRWISADVIDLRAIQLRNFS